MANRSKNETLTEDLKFHFVFNIEEDLDKVSQDLQIAFETGREYIPLEKGMQWISAEECLKLKKKALTKKQIFVLEEFSGKAFDFLKSTTALVLGPRCFMSCILDGTAIPLGSSPVFTAAMRDLVVSASGLNTDEKKRICRLVQWMGGFYSDTINMACTHLVSNTVKSTKYEKAAEIKKIKIVHPDWVDDVWDTSRIRNVLATDSIFDRHKLPVFYKLSITSSGIYKEEKNKIQKIIEQNGGSFEGLFRSEITDILICLDVGGEKYTAAVKFRKDCLRPEWLYDSLEQGYAIAMDRYRVGSGSRSKMSTPKKENDNIDFTLNCSNLSSITQLDGQKCRDVNETLSSNDTTAGNVVLRTTRARANTTTSKYKEILGQLSIQTAKKSGPFLDGCIVYLCGFTKPEKDLLNKILSNASAVRYDELDDMISHIIVGGEPSASDMKFMRDNYGKCVAVTLNWLNECVTKKRPIDTLPFRYDIPTAVIASSSKPADTKTPGGAKVSGELSVAPHDTPSPSSKKLISSTSKLFKKPKIPKFCLDSTDDAVEQLAVAGTSKQIPKTAPITNAAIVEREESIVEQYLQKSSQQPSPPPVENHPIPSQQSQFEAVDSMASEFSEDLSVILATKKLCFFGFEPSEVQQFIERTQTCGALIVDDFRTKRIPVDYLVLPTILTDGDLLKNVPETVENVVNDLWLEDVYDKKLIVDIEYYHRPIVVNETEDHLLNGMVIVISTYSGSERIFLTDLSAALGADVQEIYNRSMKPILVCPLPDGKKYNASIKWKLPSVTCDWVIQCATEKTLIPYSKFAVNLEDRDQSGIIPSTQPDEAKSNVSLSSSNKRKSDDMTDCGPSKRAQPASSNLDHTPLREKKNENRAEQRRLSPTKSAGSDCGGGTMTPVTMSCQRFPTPNRPTIYKFLKEVEEEERLAKLMETPGKKKVLAVTPKPFELPEHLRTPPADYGYRDNATPDSRWRFRNDLKALDRIWEKAQNQPKLKPKTPDTPISEVMKRFWKDALGDAYVELNTQQFSQRFTQHPSKQQSSTAVKPVSGTSTITSNTTSAVKEVPQPVVVVEKPSSKTTTTLNTQNIGEAPELVQELHAFVKNQKADERRSFEPKFDVDSVPFDDSSMEAAAVAAVAVAGGTESERIGWHDPADFDLLRRKSAKAPMQYTGTPRFIISCNDITRKTNVMNKILSLKGVNCDPNIPFDVNCTHVLCEQPNRGGKICSTIASGKWMLGLKYIDDSVEAGYFLDEQDYEWGNPRATCLPELSATDQQTANAAFRWRTKISTQSGKAMGAFTGFRAILHVAKRELFQKLIEAGGGVVIDATLPYEESDDALTATHCFVEPRKMKLPHSDHKTLAEAGIRVLSVIYLNDYIMGESVPDFNKYLIPMEY